MSNKINLVVDFLLKMYIQVLVHQKQNQKGVNMTDEQVKMICEVLKDITKALDKNNATLNTILGHYNGIVPQMRENVDRANRFGREAETRDVDNAIAN